ncbi:MAG: hypothetical protein HYW14_06315 [Planctomycetes bacterium]|nr:hypothetical protein [Planctomycetota bacterium]
MIKKIAYIWIFLIFSIYQIDSRIPLGSETKDVPSGEAKEAPTTGGQKMSEREFFNAVQMPEYTDYTKKASQLYNEDKYKESIEISKKVLDLYNERYEEIKKGYEKYSASKEVQKKLECFPIFQYAIATYAETAATEHKAHTMPERYFMLLKANKLFEYVSAVYPKDYRQSAYFSTTKRLLFNAKVKSKFIEEEVKTYEDTVNPYDFTKEEKRTLKNAVELIDKVDKIAKEYKPKPVAPRPEPVVTPPGEGLPPAEGATSEKGSAVEK